MSYNNYMGAQAGQSPEDYNRPVRPSELVSQQPDQVDPSTREDYDEMPDDGASSDDIINYLNSLPAGADPCDPNSEYYDAALCEAMQELGMVAPPAPQEYAEAPPSSAAPAPSAPGGGGGSSYGGGGAASAPYSPDAAPMAPQANPYTNTDPQGGSFSTTPTPYTDDQGYPTDAGGNPSDAYGNPLDANGQPTDSNGNPLPTDANGNADPSQLGPTDQSQPPVSPQSQYQPSCEQLVFAVPQSLIPTGDINAGDAANMQLQRQMLYDQTGPLGTVGVIAMPKIPGIDTPPYALVALNLFVQDPATGLLSYLAFGDLSGAAMRIFAQSWGADSNKYMRDPPGIVQAIRAACPQFMDLQDLIASGQLPTFDAQQVVDASTIQIPGWNWQPADDTGLTDQYGNPVDEYGNPVAYQAGKKTMPTMRGDFVIMGAGKVLPVATPTRGTNRKGQSTSPSKDSKSKKPIPKAMKGVRVPKNLKGYFTKSKVSPYKSQKVADAAAAARAAMQAEKNRQKSMHAAFAPGYSPTSQSTPGAYWQSSLRSQKAADSLAAYRQNQRSAQYQSNPYYKQVANGRGVVTKAGGMRQASSLVDATASAANARNVPSRVSVAKGTYSAPTPANRPGRR